MNRRSRTALFAAPWTAAASSFLTPRRRTTGPFVVMQTTITTTTSPPSPTTASSSSSSSSSLSSSIGSGRRYVQPVPMNNTRVFPVQRGRNSRKRSRHAEYFRRYMYLRRLLKPWSDDFRLQHGRTPNLVDVHESDVPGLLDRFIDYLDALEALRDD